MNDPDTKKPARAPADPAGTRDADSPSQDGVPGTDELLDHSLDETFPASDPISPGVGSGDDERPPDTPVPAKSGTKPAAAKG
jgi:hypothetical protein